MSRNFLKIVSAICVIALVACGAVILGRSIHIGTHYENAEQYTAGGTTLKDTVKNLDIHWTDGSVTFAYHAQDTVEIAETAPKAISGDAEMRWWLDGDTLRVQYAKSGYRSLLGLNKALTVTLPEGIALGDVNIDVTSGDVNVPDLIADGVRVDLTSGNLALKQSGASERVRLSATSGSIRAELADVQELAVGGTSAAIQVALGSVKQASFSTTSGNIAVEGDAAGKVGIDSTSGRISVRLAAFDDLKIDATSGDIEAALPSEPGYTAHIDTTSGKFDYTVALAREGSAYTCGDGSAKFSVDTTSGNIRLTEADAQ